jgi:hypothetical protein
MTATAPTDVTITGHIYDVKQTITNVLINYSASLPSAEQAAVLSALNAPSPVDTIVQSLQALYSATKKGVSDATAAAFIAEAMGEAAYQVFVNGLHGMGPTAQAMYLVARRQLGATTTPDPSTDPAIPAQFAPAPTTTP